MSTTRKRAITIGVAMAEATLLLIWLLVPVGVVHAQSGLEPSEETLAFRGKVNETLQRTFTLTANQPIQNLEIVCHDPVDAQTERPILCTTISLDPPDKDEMDGPERFTITINTGTTPGIFAGELEFRYQDQPDDESVVVGLEITVEPVPSVDTDVNSKNPTLVVAPPWNSSPFGRPSASKDSPVMGEVVISLVQSEEGEASIVEASMLAFRNNDNQTLPDYAVRIASGFPMDIENGDAASVRVVAGGQNLRAGEYNGTVLFRVQNQPAAVQVPVKVQVKDGPWLALLLLIAGPIVGLLINWWNSEGMARFNLMKEIDKLEDRIDKRKSLLPVETRKQAGALLEQAQDAHLAGEKPEDIKKSLKQANDLLDAAKEAAETFLVEKLKPLVEKIEDLELGQAYLNQQKADLESIKESIENSGYDRLEDAEGELGKVTKNVDALEVVIAEVNKLVASSELSDKEKRALKYKVNQATSIKDMNDAVEKAKKQTGEEEIEEGSFSAWKEETVGLTSTQLALKLERLRLRWGSIAVTIVVYAFTVAVGMVTLYVIKPTFGSNPEDYVTVFLWGLASNLLGGQTIDLKALHTKAKETS